MSDALVPIRKKVDRAEKHLRDFKSAVGLGPRPIQGPTTHAIHLNRDRHIEYTTNLPEPGPEAGIILGDVLHQLRTSLDHLVCALIRRNHSASVCKDAVFPICKDSNDFKTDWRISKGILEPLIGTDELALIEFTQPYKRLPNNPTGDRLWILAKLNNIDKHRVVLVLNPTLTYGGNVHIGGHVEPFSRSKQPIKPGANVLDLGGPFPDEPFAVDMQRLTPYIVLSETDGLCDNLSIFPIVRGMISRVNCIIDDFERFFH